MKSKLRPVCKQSKAQSAIGAGGNAYLSKGKKREDLRRAVGLTMTAT